MITIKKLNLDIGNKKILKNINLILPRFGLISIVGISGCGKTSFLNCIGGLLNYSGEIISDNEYLNRMSENQMAIFRLKNIGFVFQDFKLFEFISAIENIQFPLNLLSNFNDDIKKRKCDDLLELVGMSRDKNKPIKKMSGGEKQRIAIARALVNDPKIILADEPTGSLDSNNSQKIMEILSEVSKRTLVIIVTHDFEIAKSYSDQIIEMSDGTIKNVLFNEKRETNSFVPLFKNFHSNKKPNLPISFLFKHSKSSLMSKKWRRRVCNLVTSLGLLGLGLSCSLSSTISAGLKNAYSTIIDDSRIVVTPKESKDAVISSVSEEMVDKIAFDYKEFVEGYGIAYKADFEAFFKDENKCTVFGENESLVLEDYAARSINEFIWLSDCGRDIYPKLSDELNDDEIILSLNQKTLNDICFSLHIQRNIESLENYLKKNKLYGYFSFKNSDWNYSDEFLFTIKGFVIDFEPYIVHSNRFWNKYVFEDCMRLPANEKLYEYEYYPWVMKKCYYLNSLSNKGTLLESLNKNHDCFGCVFEIADTNFFPWLYRNKDINERNRILVLSDENSSIPYYLPEVLMEECDNISSPIFGTASGYAIYGDNMMAGFSKPMYFSADENMINEVVDLYESINIDSAESVELPNGILMGHFSKTLQNNVIFNVLNNEDIIGKPPVLFEDIAISKGLALSLFGNLNCINKKLCIAFAYHEILIGNSQIKREFVRKELSITGIVESEKLAIYHNSYWTIGFFQTVIGISACDLIPQSVSFNCGSSDSAEQATKIIEEAYPQYRVINPEILIKESVDGVTKYLNIILLVFSIVCSLISVIILYLCNLIHANESRKDIGLSCCVGMYKKEANKFIYFHSFLLCIISFLMASFELLIINIATSYELYKNMGGVFSININPLPYLLMFLFSIIISVFSCIFLSRKFNKISAISLLK